jgi:hypothetical protein
MAKKQQKKQEQSAATGRMVQLKCPFGAPERRSRDEYADMNDQELDRAVRYIYERIDRIKESTQQPAVEWELELMYALREADLRSERVDLHRTYIRSRKEGFENEAN